MYNYNQVSFHHQTKTYAWKWKLVVWNQ